MTTPPLTNEDKTRLLAEAVGATYLIDCSCFAHWPASMFETLHRVSQSCQWSDEKEGMVFASFPDFLADANAAMTLVEFAKGKGFSIFIECRSELWVVEFCLAENPVPFAAREPTLPLAIAHAFARAFNLEGNWEDGDL